MSLISRIHYRIYQFKDDCHLMGIPTAIKWGFERIFIDPIYSIYKKLERMIWWGWRMRNNYDWDFQYLYVVMYYKLYRLKKHMIDEVDAGREGFISVWQCDKKSRRRRALITATEIMRRLAFDNDIFYRNQIRDLSNKRFMNSVKKDAAYRQEHIDMFYDIIKKHGEGWWE